jgi:hypothetical protein
MPYARKKLEGTGEGGIHRRGQNQRKYRPANVNNVKNMGRLPRNTLKTPT